MSGRMVSEVLDNAPEDLRPTDLLVLVALAESAVEHTRQATHKTGSVDLANRARVSPGAVRNSLSRLTQRGLIRPLIPRKEIMKGNVQHYEITRLNAAHRSVRWSAGTQTASSHDDTVDDGQRHHVMTR